MSFSSSLKKDICQNRPFIYPKKRAVCFGMLLFGRNFEEGTICLHTENRQVAKLYSSLIYQLVEIRTSITVTEQITRDERKLFIVTVDSLEDRRAVQQYFAPLYQKFLECDPGQERDLEFLHGVLCGAFLSCANISDPQKSYHLEFVAHHALADQSLGVLLQKLSIRYNHTTRKGARLLYVKSSEAIEDVLTMLGAGNTALEVMNVKIYKDMRNKVNRITNCETANIDKTVTAAAAQIGKIRLIERQVGIESLPPGLREVARLRLQNPDMPLSELAQALHPPLSRSGVNYRLRQLCAMADELQNKR